MTKYYLRQGGVVSGPLSSSEIKRLALDGKIDGANDHVSNDQQKWFLAQNIKGLFPNTAAASSKSRADDHSYDVFISYSKYDKSVANAACATLEQRGIRCWIAPRDIVPGSDWTEAIIEGIEACRVLVLIYSANSNQSRQVVREVERAVNKGLAIIPFRLEDTPLSRGLEYCISLALA